MHPIVFYIIFVLLCLLIVTIGCVWMSKNECCAHCSLPNPLPELDENSTKTQELKLPKQYHPTITRYPRRYSGSHRERQVSNEAE